MITHTEENYLKAIFKIAEREKNAASTNSIAAVLSTSAASVSDMLKRLSEKGLINYKKYKGVTLTQEGSKIATNLIRKPACSKESVSQQAKKPANFRRLREKILRTTLMSSVGVSLILPLAPVVRKNRYFSCPLETQSPSQSSSSVPPNPPPSPFNSLV